MTRPAPMKNRLLPFLFVLCAGEIAAQQITLNAGPHLTSVPVANRIATQLPDAPDLASALFLVEPISLGSWPGGLNNNGQAVGWSNAQLFFHSNGVTTPISGYSFPSYVGRQLNDAGKFIGSVVPGDGTGNYGSGIGRDSAVFTPTGAGHFSSLAYGGVVLNSLNNLGWLLGTDVSKVSQADFQNRGDWSGLHFVSRSAGSYMNLLLPPPRNKPFAGILYSLNDSGEVVGSDILAVYFSPTGQFRRLPGYGIFDEAHEINARGQIIGITTDPNTINLYAAFWEGGNADVMDVLPYGTGYPYAWPYGINRYGQIVGENADGPVLWINKKIVNLQGKIINPTNTRIYSFRDINDQGEILSDNSSALLHPFWPLAVDANHDGTIKLASEDTSDVTSAAKPYRFWINDDINYGDIADSNETDIPGQAVQIVSGYNNGPDYLTNEVSGVGDIGLVHGTRDLVDYFPVFMDMKQLVNALPPSATVKYKLKQADGAVNFVYTNLTRATAFDYQRNLLTTGFGPALAQPAFSATKYHITPTGIDLFGGTTGSSAFLDAIRNRDGGVILVDGRAATTNPLVLSIEKADGTVIAEVKLYLSISGVETMFRHLNLHDRNLPGLVGSKADSAQPEAMGDPTGFPDAPNSDSRWLIFVHGFNVGGQEARGWNAEMFKRLYWSRGPDGKFFKSRFVGVSWFGSPDPGSLGLPADYHLAMRNAMVTAPVLAQAIKALPGSAGTKTMFAHSLGCGVISSAIADHGMTVGRVCFVDAALARECFDGRSPGTFTSENDGMTPAVWKPYSPRLYAANWFARFDPTTDARGKLTWNNRFSGASSAVYNFYSSTEDVLAEYTGELPSTLGGIAWYSGLHGSFGWVYQEKGKGNRQNYGLGGPPLTHLGSYYGGWGMNLKDPVLGGDTPYWKWVSSDSYIGRVIKTPAEIGAVSDSVLGRHPVFEPGWGVVRNQEQQETPVSNVSPVAGAPSWIYNLYLASGNTLAGNSDNRAQLLAEAIPSLTWCMGSHVSTGLQSGRNFNLPELVDQTNWPRGLLNNTTPKWFHSDMREVAYIYQYGVFDKIVGLSKP